MYCEQFMTSNYGVHDVDGDVEGLSRHAWGGWGVRVGGACIANDTQLAHLRPDKCHLTRQLAGITVVTTGNLERFRNGSAE